MNDAVRRRRRIRPQAGSDVEPGAAQPPVRPANEPAGVLVEPVAEPVADADASPIERGLRGLVGGGSSQVSPAAALRARDAARPRPEDLARAEAELLIIQRHWTPRD